MSGFKRWLLERRCPHCPHDCEPATKYGIRKTHEGWQCNGYRSKYWDEGYAFEYKPRRNR